MKTVNKHYIIKSLSNVKKIDEAFKDEKIAIRIKQTSNGDIVQKFYRLEKNIKYVLGIIEDHLPLVFESLKIQHKTILASPNSNENALYQLLEYHSLTISTLCQSLQETHQELRSVIGSTENLND